MKKILIVDDDAEIRENLAVILKGEGYRTDDAGAAREAIEKAKSDEFDVVLLDFVMPKMSGIDALIEIRKARPKTKVIMITGFATVESAVDAIKKGASDYLSKPVDGARLKAALDRAEQQLAAGSAPAPAEFPEQHPHPQG